MTALGAGLGVALLVIFGVASDKPLTAWDALVLLSIALITAGISDLLERT